MNKVINKILSTFKHNIYWRFMTEDTKKLSQVKKKNIR